MRSRTAIGILSASALLALAGCYYYVPKAIYEEKFEKSWSGIRAVSVGSRRGNVEVHLGKPTKSATLPDGRRVDTYEVIGAPGEGGRWDKQRIQITYRRDDRVAETRLAPATQRWQPERWAVAPTAQHRTNTWLQMKRTAARRSMRQ